MEWAKLIGDAIWPAALLVFFWPFRKKLTGSWDGVREYLKDKNISATAPGVAINIERVEAALEAQKETLPEAVLPEGYTAPSSENITGDAVTTLPPADREAVNMVEAVLVKSANQFAPQDRIPNLIRALALSRIQAAHEFFYARIFGSQIAALKRLNVVGKISQHDAVAAYEAVKERFPDVYRDYGFEGWSGFLVNGKLASFENGFYEITPYGRDFLNFMNDARLTEDKPW